MTHLTVPGIISIYFQRTPGHEVALASGKPCIEIVLSCKYELALSGCIMVDGRFLQYNTQVVDGHPKEWLC